MRLAPRRFPDSITRIRQEPGHYDDDTGAWIPGAVTKTNFRASVQPLTLKDADTAGGVQVSHRLSVHVPQPGALAAALDDREADRARVDGIEFVVEESQSWRGSHTRAILLRET